MKLLNSRGFKVSLFLLVLAGVSFFIQNTFYGYIDENNVLQDSIFLPLGWVLLLLGVVGLIISSVWVLFQDKGAFQCTKHIKKGAMNCTLR